MKKAKHTLEVFKCAPLSNARLTRSACGRRHARARAKGEKGIPGLVTGTCARCEVGARHAKGEAPRRWASGAPVEVVQIQPVLGQQRLNGPGTPAPKPYRKPKAKTRQ